MLQTLAFRIHRALLVDRTSPWVMRWHPGGLVRTVHEVPRQAPKARYYLYGVRVPAWAGRQIANWAERLTGHARQTRVIGRIPRSQ